MKKEVKESFAKMNEAHDKLDSVQDNLIYELFKNNFNITYDDICNFEGEFEIPTLNGKADINKKYSNKKEAEFDIDFYNKAILLVRQYGDSNVKYTSTKGKFKIIKTIGEHNITMYLNENQSFTITKGIQHQIHCLTENGNIILLFTKQ